MKSKTSLMEEIPSFKLIESFIPIIHIKINDGMEELKGRPFHWCVEVKINGDTPGIVRMQKVPGAQMPKWDCLLTFIPPSGHTQDIKLNPEFTEHFPMFNFVCAMNFNPLVYCNIADDPWGHTTVPNWAPYSSELSGRVEQRLKALMRCGREFGQFHEDVGERDARIGGVLTAGLIIMAQFIEAPRQWRERPIAHPFPCTMDIISDPIERLVQTVTTGRGKRKICELV